MTSQRKKVTGSCITFFLLVQKLLSIKLCAAEIAWFEEGLLKTLFDTFFLHLCFYYCYATVAADMLKGQFSPSSQQHC